MFAKGALKSNGVSSGDILFSTWQSLKLPKLKEGNKCIGIRSAIDMVILPRGLVEPCIPRLLSGCLMWPISLLTWSQMVKDAWHLFLVAWITRRCVITYLMCFGICEFDVEIILSQVPEAWTLCTHKIPAIDPLKHMKYPLWVNSLTLNNIKPTKINVQP